MVTYIILAMAILVFGLVRAHKKRNDLKNYSLIITASISLALSVLSFPYYLKKYNDLLLAFLSGIRYGPSAITMKVENDLIPVLELAEPLASFYKTFLYLLYIAAPISASVVIISYSRFLTESLRGMFAKTIHVFSDLNEQSISIAESIPSQGRKSLVLFCNIDKVNDESLKTRARRINALLINRKDTDIYLFKNHRYEFYEIQGSNNTSISSLWNLCSHLLKEKNYQQENVVVRCFMSRELLEYTRRIDRTYGEKVYIRYIDEDSVTTMELLRQVKDRVVLNRKHELVILGSSKIANEIVSSYLYLMQEPESSCTIHVIDKDGEKMLRKMKLESPEIINGDLSIYKDNKVYKEKNYDIRFHCCAADDWSAMEILGQITDPELICTCTEDDKVNYDLAQNIKRFYASSNNQLKYPLIAALVRSPEINKMVKDDTDIIYFGNYEHCYSYSRIINPDLETVAKRTHLAYMSGTIEDVFNKSASEQEKILRDTGYYSYQNIDSSMAEGLTLEYRYAYILSLKDDDSVSDDEFVERWLKDEENLRTIGNSEHNRWMAYERLQGWRKPTVEQEEIIVAASNGKRVKDNEMLLHPAIVNVEDLPEAEKTADALLRKYNPDSSSTRYVELDRDIYKMMVRILKG